MIHYSIQIILFQFVFLLIYEMFLKRETFFNYNRVYLILTNLLSLVLPFLKIESLKKLDPQNNIVNLPEIFISNEIALLNGNEANVFNWFIFSMQGIVYLGMLITLAIFCFKLIKLKHLINNNPKQKTIKSTIVTLRDSDMAFSFFKYVFIGDQLSTEERRCVLIHEHVHVTEKHSIDLIFIELQRIVFWFNPFIYVYQNRIATLHEYIADYKVLETHNKKDYYKSLLAQAFSVKDISFINPFFKQSLIKKRIIMLSKSKSNQRRLFKYALLIPAVAGMLFYTACSQQASSEKQNPNLESRALEIIKTNSVENKEVAFSMVDKVPVFPGCETSEDQKKCFSTNINKLVGKNFNTQLAEDLNLEGVQKIRVFFKISESGELKDIKSRASHPELEEEAKRVIKLLPKLAPGSHNGQPVTVPYYLPINFKIKA